jgi:membrane protease YdiL (CAAX protease family)
MAPSCHDPGVSTEVLEEAGATPVQGPSVGRRLWTRFVAAPRYPAVPEDLRTVSLAGVELPIRAGLAVAITTFAILFDYSRTFIPESVLAMGLAAEAMRYQALERVVMFGLVPLAIVLLVFRDRPSRYGLTLGDWRSGLALAAVGIVLMTPVVAWLASLPDFRAYYSPSAAPVGDLAVTYGLDLFASEFLLRGFLMFALLRVIGPIGLLVATMPFVFAHLGKPEIELFSTLFGGLVYAWVDWRTGSIVWSVIAHTYIVTLLITLASG